MLGVFFTASVNFQVDFVSGRDIRRIDIGNIVNVLQSWYYFANPPLFFKTCSFRGDNCDAVLHTIEKQVEKVRNINFYIL